MLDLYYLIASFPTLTPLKKSLPIDSQDFFGLCQSRLKESLFKTLKHCQLFDFSTPKKNQVFKQWLEHEIYLRDQLTLLRASKLKKDPTPFLRGKNAIKKINLEIKTIFENPNPFEAEEKFYLYRWRTLERIESGQYFNFNFLVVYSLKLQLYEKRKQQNQTNHQKHLQEILEVISDG